LRGLSSRVGIRLFDRTARAVALTEEGRSYYQRVKPVYRKFKPRT
jgi:DNA-binding transcriptional LysR family regulator